MKNKVYNLLFVIIIILSLSVVLLFINNNEKIEYINDLTIQEKINDYKLDVTYLKGNTFNESLTYGNTYEKEIEILNNNNEDITIAINLEDMDISNNSTYYSIYYKLDNESNYEILKEETNIDSKLIYNLMVYKNSFIKIKIIIKTYYEQDTTSIKGTFKVSNNLSSKDIFISKLNSIHFSILDEINNLNGINTPGIYYKKIDGDISGYVIIDAKDISDIIYVYTLKNDMYMIKNYKYKNKFKKSSILSNDTSIDNINNDDVCKMHSKKECLDFNNLSYNTLGNKLEFNEKIDEVIKKINNNYENKVYVIDVNTLNIENIRGFVLINNKDNNKEIYLYLTNDLFMISGYNLTKLGNVDVNSSTIRAYNESAFNLSSKDMLTVCHFSGFDECYDIENNLI